ncbi:hypothetical protein COI89_22000 [Bacillus cereus]|nr:hypothetical protein COI89_22000 [Bacillus cereus]
MLGSSQPLASLSVNRKNILMSLSLLFRSYISRYLRVVRLPPQNSANARKLDGKSTTRKSPIGEGS